MYLGALGADGLTKLSFHEKIIIQNTPQLLVADNQNHNQSQSILNQF